MSKDLYSIKNVMEQIVPITRFNRGEVLVNPAQHKYMVELIEDYALFIEAEKRMANTVEEDYLTEQQVLDIFNISEKDLEDIDVEIE